MSERMTDSKFFQNTSWRDVFKHLDPENYNLEAAVAEADRIQQQQEEFLNNRVVTQDATRRSYLARGLLPASAGGTNGWAIDYGSSGVAVPTSPGSVTGIGQITVNAEENRLLIVNFIGPYRDDAAGGTQVKGFLRFKLNGTYTGYWTSHSGTADQDYDTLQARFPWIIGPSRKDPTYTIDVEWFVTVASSTTDTPVIWVEDGGSILGTGY